MGWFNWGSKKKEISADDLTQMDLGETYRRLSIWVDGIPELLDRRYSAIDSDVVNEIVDEIRKEFKFPEYQWELFDCDNFCAAIYTRFCEKFVERAPKGSGAPAIWIVRVYDFNNGGIHAILGFETKDFGPCFFDATPSDRWPRGEWINSFSRSKIDILF